MDKAEELQTQIELLKRRYFDLERDRMEIFKRLQHIEDYLRNRDMDFHAVRLQ